MLRRVESSRMFSAGQVLEASAEGCREEVVSNLGNSVLPDNFQKLLWPFALAGS